MAQSIVDQNKSLGSSAGSPRDTSKRKARGDSYSAKIASSSNNSRDTMKQSQSRIRKGDNDPIKGSYEGLQHSSGTLINVNGSGYDNKSIQQARYNKDHISHNDARLYKEDFKLNRNYSIIDNYSSLKVSGTSSDRLSKIVKNNMMFG